MKKITAIFIAAVVISLAVQAFAEDDIARRLSDILVQAVEDGHWQVSAEEVSMWTKTKKTDFLLVDVRPGAEAFKTGHIPGAIHVPYNEILKADRLAILPKDKKIVLICATGQLENLPVVPLRLLGYNAYTLAFGYAAWARGSHGGEAMKTAVRKAATKNYPMEK